MLQATVSFGKQLCEWRRRRRLSQLALALQVSVSVRHLGFLELGRAAPSRGLVLRLAEELDIPLRERNVWLIAAGFAPVFHETPLHDPSIQPLLSAIGRTIEAHKPFPAFAIDRHWNVVASNAALQELYEGVSAELLEPPVNVMRLSLHPDGLAPRIFNLDDWADHLLTRLRREVELTADPRLCDLLKEAEALHGSSGKPAHSHHASAFAIPLRIQTRLGLLSFFSTVTVFGTPVDITISEIALEMLYPADHETDLIVRAAPAK
ncbi:helix-turn-helix domain-containing protein [Phyllobacterium sp. P30BS-XVII]|uniref:helix-turn-helix domain-containing protein n=1 Tax=Phyllobacterium sp. P30BS-XVII TaxID=2587046 RepID=UPI000DD9043D|nr:helix-turn-helix domain-containing protein [Phyllobacterium sp. P30BS-XVII]MBA8903886.1 transcriptional regulator with XRE-family HTH domain [Phyllobacterium sp. P30BS-XVII]